MTSNPRLLPVPNINFQQMVSFGAVTLNTIELRKVVMTNTGILPDWWQICNACKRLSTWHLSICIWWRDAFEDIPKERLHRTRTKHWSYGTKEYTYIICVFVHIISFLKNPLLLLLSFYSEFLGSIHAIGFFWGADAGCVPCIGAGGFVGAGVASAGH